MTKRFAPYLALAIFASAAAVPASAVDFEADVKPILLSNCVECHGDPTNKINGDLNMLVPEEFSRRIGQGTYLKDDFVIVPGKPEESEIYKRISLPADHDDRMPPRRKTPDPLLPSQVATIKSWIQEGAAFESGAAPMTTKTEAPDKTALQTWVSTTGTEIKAYFVSFDGTNVTLKSEDGQVKPFPMSVFSAESQALVKKLAEQ